MTILIVNKEALNIESWYEADQPNQAMYGGPWGNPELTVHLPLPEGMVKEDAAAELQDEQIVIVENPEKKAERIKRERNSKLSALRSMRDAKLKEADVMINELTLGLRTDLEEIKNFRQALLDITEDYKKANGDAKAIIDNLDLEDETIWPVKPEVPEEEPTP